MNSKFIAIYLVSLIAAVAAYPYYPRYGGGQGFGMGIGQACKYYHELFIDFDDPT